MIGVVTFPGSNGDHDALNAITEDIGAPAELVDYRETDIGRYSAFVLPGGFSSGDALRCGAIARFAPIMGPIAQFAERGGPVLGICNGFQVLTEAGLLPGALMRNARLRFVCKDVTLKVETSDSPFTRRYRQGQVIRIPIAHNEGNYYADEETLDRLAEEDRIAFRYCSLSGETDDAANPNGSRSNIAGILNERRNVLGLMPHPERMAEPALGGTDGRGLFESLMAALS